MAKKFAEYKGLNLTEVNNSILQEWKKNDVFTRSVKEREGYPEFVFYEGPPSANGHPGIHHVLARTIKESRGDSLRNRVAIVYVRSAHLNAKNHPILVLIAIVCAGFARVCSNFVIWKREYLRRDVSRDGILPVSLAEY